MDEAVQYSTVAYNLLFSVVSIITILWVIYKVTNDHIARNTEQSRDSQQKFEGEFVPVLTALITKFLLLALMVLFFNTIKPITTNYVKRSSIHFIMDAFVFISSVNAISILIDKLTEIFSNGNCCNLFEKSRLVKRQTDFKSMVLSGILTVIIAGYIFSYYQYYLKLTILMVILAVISHIFYDIILIAESHGLRKHIRLRSPIRKHRLLSIKTVDGRYHVGIEYFDVRNSEYITILEKNGLLHINPNIISTKKELDEIEEYFDMFINIIISNHYEGKNIIEKECEYYQSLINTLEDEVRGVVNKIDECERAINYEKSLLHENKGAIDDIINKRDKLNSELERLKLEVKEIVKQIKKFSNAIV